MAMELVLASYLVFAVASFFTYILPMMVAFHRRHESYTVIFLMHFVDGLDWFYLAGMSDLGSCSKRQAE